MEKDAATLYCPNENCQADNRLNEKLCQRCQTPLLKRYLWVAGEKKDLGKVGELLAQRYLIVGKSVVLDTKPALVPQVPELENLQSLRAYLRLFPYRLNVPQVYGILAISEGNSHQEILLLERPPLLLNHLPEEVKLQDTLALAWHQATSMRQLNWLWQIAHLWQPLASEGVASTLLNPALLLVEGSLVRLLELHSDGEKHPNLSDLGSFWQTELLPYAKDAIASFLGAACKGLINGKIRSGEQLVEILDQGLAELGRNSQPSTSSKFATSVKIVTQSDQGPSRQRNEDSCYPSSGTIIDSGTSETPLAIVCDGIGGHEGGNVASNLAIEVIEKKIQEINSHYHSDIDPANLIAELEQAAAIANDRISEENDSEGKQGRQRMGTTLVMALPVAHEMYITHVGDSRAYLITHQGCYQVTLDDDVATREVRLGYAVYRDAIQQGASGSLVQALGMSSSNSLHPTAQRFVLDEDCVFLLCSDGLSDFDRVEQYWESDILPILNGKADLLGVANRLVEIANTQNGHDNVTVALVHYQLQYHEPENAIAATAAEIITDTNSKSTASRLYPRNNQNTKVIPDTSRASANQAPKMPLHLLALAFVVGSGLVIGYLWQRNFPFNPIGTTAPATTSQPANSSRNNRNSSPTAPPEAFIKLQNPTPYSTTQNPFQPAANLPSGTILKIQNVNYNNSKNEGDKSTERIKVYICQIAADDSSVEPSASENANSGSRLPQGEIWIESAKLKSVLELPRGGNNPCLEANGNPNTSTQLNSPRK
ncbi:PP2C family protein-serine/threonine phosphatase [Calothrix sp. PCC 6303]|uniref:PP2C family protein-serine/threonine phosphatase n=1 Tax=Calothrix sp. PCC 6303 TaxID=1170562 RepID=UPI0002A010B9|nr:protein phosphatase 2C domain-containing protein [Calothrix sp. PCC 6303]AFZ00326.1 protein serine/threonine phosphatase [Calothrix sp. PCC 6303]